MFNPYAPPEQNPYPYYTEQSPYYAASPILVPYPTHTFSYDPYWPSRVTPSAHPLVFVSTKRFRGEVHSGNCLLIYE